MGGTLLEQSGEEQQEAPPPQFVWVPAEDCRFYFPFETFTCSAVSAHLLHG